VMEYARSCRLGADTSCAIEQDAYKHQALVLEDRKRDSDGVFTCPLEKQRWGPDNVALHSCTTNRQFLDCNAINGAPKPRFCKQLDNCPNRFNPGQEDFDNDATGNACDWGWTSDPATAVTFQKFGDFNGDHRADIVVTRGGNTPGSSSALSSGALGILTFDGTSLTTLVAAPHMTAFGTWLYDSNKDRILAIGDFDHDFRDEILVVRPADADGRGRVGILKYNGAVSDQAKRLMPLFVATDETWFGGWRFQSAVTRIVGTADINGDGRKDIVITSAWGIGVLTYDGGSLTSLTVQRNGTKFGRSGNSSGDWVLDTLLNSIEGFGDFDGDGNVIPPSQYSRLTRLRKRSP